MGKQCRKWTDDEKRYLEDNWDSKSKKAIAKKLNRTVEAIKIKAHRIGLRDMLRTSDFMTFGELLGALHITYYGKLPFKLEALGFPFKYKYPNKELKVRVVKIEEFLKWCEKHPDVLSFAKLEPYGLGLENEFVESKRKRDREKPSRKIWSTSDDILLTQLLSLQVFTEEELAERFKCTGRAIQRRAYHLKLTDRPISRGDLVKRGRPRKPDAEKWKPTYIPKARDRKQTAVELRGVKIYQYDVETHDFVGMYESIGEASYDYGIPVSTLASSTRRCPEGIVINDMLFSRIPMTREDDDND